MLKRWHQRSTSPPPQKIRSSASFVYPFNVPCLKAVWISTSANHCNRFDAELPSSTLQALLLSARVRDLFRAVIYRNGPAGCRVLLTAHTPLFIIRDLTRPESSKGTSHICRACSCRLGCRFSQYCELPFLPVYSFHRVGLSFNFGALVQPSPERNL